MKANRGCRTCKDRKIGCDKSMPSCNNCIRTNRQCLGYGLRLTWPDRKTRKGKGQVDQANSAFDTQTEIRLTQQRGWQFLNFTFEDVAFATGTRTRHQLLASLATPGPTYSLSLHASFMDQDGILLRYYEKVISSMVSTTRANNGFCTEILPMALSCQSPPAMALCSAMLAIAAYHHLGAKAAMPYKTNALRWLSESLVVTRADSGGEVSEAQLAACMMLCMYSVFDEEEGHWHLHLNGARKILASLQICEQYKASSNFLVNWYLYYEVLGQFTQPSDDICKDFNILSLIQTPRTDITIIVGSLGCSIETFHILHLINQIRRSSPSNSAGSDLSVAAQKRVVLEKRLQNLTQRLDPDEEEAANTIECARIVATANFYRLAALLYLQRVFPIEGDQARRNRYLNEARVASESLHVVTSPWPMFVVACESRTEDQRLAVLTMLDEMQRRRSIGNIRVMRNVIETIWKQCDLRSEFDHEQQLEWCRFVDSDVMVPWFA
ncbi:fungal-specific transcription factor domain-containing protein [Dactylonectria estremocensis]|uniref:Fungal-specific transcription factor domain-containing protein n=1 Tax=Dactylonectria estremocensis TaxID=1079267 RepID=A0A9P9EKU3_9HYPO|nr:fungal-specific transcription factor domain-containing protein [Dactylonectria estremocensis]